MPPRASRRRASSDNPTLPIALPAPSALPGRIRPERAVPCQAAFDASHWRFSVDWDGIRALLFAGADGTIRLQGERLQDLTPLVPELAAVAGALPERSAVLDGVVTLLDPEGRPDLAALAERLCGGPRVAPAVFLATDLLHLDGTPTMPWAFERRLEVLHKLVRASAHLQVPDWVAAEGHAFCEAADERGLGGVLARRGGSRYHAGVASPDRLRIAIQDRADVVVLGAERERRSQVLLHLGEYVDGRLVPAGRAQQSWSATVALWLQSRVDDLGGAAPPHAQAATTDALSAGRSRVSWLRPHLTATVRHGGRAGDGTLRFPVVIALREDLDPGGCVRRPAVPPPADEPRATGFRPTVLATLPFTDPRRPG